MKTTFFTLGLLLVRLVGFAQGESQGVYMTSADFINNNLEVARMVRVKYGSVLLKKSGSKYFLSKSDVFGAQTAKGVFRFQNNADYQLVNQDIFSLYHQSFPFGGDTGSYEDVYYFSIKPDSEIIPLTKENLKVNFSENPKFLAMIEVLFKNDRELGQFSKLLNRFTLIYFYEESLKYSELTAER